jgi:Rrf2 family protein
MFSQTVEYALRAVVHLAQHADQSQTTDQIARRTQVPKAYLSKVLQWLARAGIVHAQRGIGGGMNLARPAGEISILEVVNAVDPLERIETCPLGLASHGTALCPLHKRMDDALAAVEDAFRRTTLQELLENPSSSIPLCDAPAAAPEGVEGVEAGAGVKRKRAGARRASGGK